MLAASSGKRNVSCNASGSSLSSAHTQHDSPGGSTRCGQRIFPLEYYEDGHTCSYCRAVMTGWTGYLIVSQAQASDSGVYKCLASNALGNVTSPARVIVTGTFKAVTRSTPGQVG